MIEKGLILDANILIRAVFGTKVRKMMTDHEESSIFYSPEICFHEARKYLPAIAERNGHELPSAVTTLENLGRLVHSVSSDSYGQFEKGAMARIGLRDPNDWPVVATALLLNLPIWTEDQDFFGTGIPTWTTDRVEIYLKG